MTEQVRLALIGCGAAARACHLPGLAMATKGRLVAVIDTASDRAEEAATIYREAIGCINGDADVEVYADLVPALSTFDAAIVATPHVTHSSIGLRLLHAGKHVLMEKPLATSMQEAEELETATRALCGQVFAMAQPRRLFPAYRWVRDLITSGALGRLKSIRWLEGGPYDWQPFSATMFEAAVSGGGVLIDAASHIFDALNWWLGDHLEVTDYADNALGGVEFDALVGLRRDETKVSVELSRLRSLGTTCEIRGEHAFASIGTDFPSGECILQSNAGTVLFRGEVKAVPPSRDTWEGIFAEQLDDFCAAIVVGTGPSAKISNGVRTLRMITDCYNQKRQQLTMPWIQDGRQ